MSSTRTSSLRVRPALGALAVVALGVASPAPAIAPPAEPSALAQRAYVKPDLRFGNSNVARDTLAGALPGATAWSAFEARYGRVTHAYVDPRSGAATGVAVSVRLFADDAWREADAAQVGAAVRAFLDDNAAALGLEISEFGPARAARVNDTLWFVRVPQVVNGVPVRHAGLAAAVKFGHLMLVGAETWGTVRARTEPALDASQALDAGFEFAGGRSLSDRLWEQPRLELLPFAPAEHQRGDAFVGPVGSGYGHRLAWVFGFRRGAEHEAWQVSVDAHSGEVLAFEDTNHYATASITGGAYLTTATDTCTLGPSGLIDWEKCGLQYSATPMPWTNTGFPVPDAFTNGHGVFNWPGGVTTTTLQGSYVRISDTCGAINETGPFGSIDMGGATGEHDCTIPAGHSAGDTSSSRSCFYEVNKLADLGRGWLPANPWLTTQVPSNVNINSSCNAFYSFSGSINFYRSSAQCRNTGELAAVFNHEWGHALDDNDANGVLSNSSEGYADIVANYRLQSSCVGYGFFKPFGAPACGFTPDGTGNNANEAQVGPPHCNLDCSGVRDSDWARHAGGVPDTPQNFVCPSCGGGSGPCAKQVHCAAAPSRQAAWDLAARDLRSAPFSLDTNTAFILASRLFYLGAGNVGNWHTCSCAAGTSDGCGATNAYMSWLVADDDDANLANGTPHMTAIFNAFNRHNIACSTPTVQNGGCPYRLPTPVVTTVSGDDYVKLSWPAVGNAAKYLVFRSEGPTGCHLGKTLIATVPAGPLVLTYADTGLLERRQYCYSVVAVGFSNDACLSRASTCTCVTTGPCGAGHSLIKEAFDNGIPGSWTVVDGGVGGGTASTWTDQDPCGHQPPAPFAAPSPMVDSKCAGTFPPPLVQDEQLITPTFDASSCKRVFLDFDNYYVWDTGGIADVDVSVDGGTSWHNVYRMEGPAHDGYPVPNHKSLDITTPASLEPTVNVRFHYRNNFLWSVDNVRVTCGCP